MPIIPIIRSHSNGGNGGNGSGIYVFNVGYGTGTNLELKDGVTYNDILNAYNAGQLPVMHVTISSGSREYSLPLAKIELGSSLTYAEFIMWDLNETPGGTTGVNEVRFVVRTNNTVTRTDYTISFSK